jgi:hypothetical protein
MLGHARIVTIASATALLGLSLCLDAQAQTVTLAQFQRPKTAKDLEFNKTYLLGVTDGLIAYNSGLDDKLFCIPGLVPKNYFRSGRRHCHALGTQDERLSRHGVGTCAVVRPQRRLSMSPAANWAMIYFSRYP